MTIKALSYWAGSLYPTYQDEVERWLKRNSSEEAFEQRETVSRDETLEEGFAWDQSAISDSNLWLHEDKTVIIDQAGSFTSPEIGMIVKRLVSLGTEFTVAFIRGGTPFASLKKVMEEDVRERFVPFQDVGAQTEWIMDWLDERSVVIAEEDAESIAQTVAEDAEMQVQIVRVLADAYPNQEITWDHIEPHLASLGALDTWALPNAIVNGDRSKAIEAAARSASTMDTAFMTLGLLRKKYRNYAIFVDSPEKGATLAEILKLNPRAITYNIREAHLLGRERISKSLRIIADIERRFKSSSMTDSASKILLEGMAASLAQQFRLARNK